MLIGPVGFYIRARTDEAEDYLQAPAHCGGSPLGHALRFLTRRITITWTVCTYFFLIYMPTYAVHQLHLPGNTSFLANGASLAVLLVLAPIFGALSGRIGRRPLLLSSAEAIAILTCPLLALLTAAPGTGSLLAFQVVFAVLIAAFTGVAPAAIAEICPPAIRSTGTSIAYNLAVTIFGGFAQARTAAAYCSGVIP